MITITNESTCGNLEYIKGDIKLTGDYRVSMAGKVTSFNIQIANNGISVGNANSYIQDNELKFNINGVTTDNSALVTAAINAMIIELTDNYTIAV